MERIKELASSETVATGLFQERGQSIIQPWRKRCNTKVLVQSHPDKGYVASVLGVPDCVAEGRTKDEAIANAKTALTEWLAQGEIVTIEVEAPQSEHPWLKFAGMWENDPTFDDFLADMEAYRREVDAEESQR